MVPALKVLVMVSVVLVVGGGVTYKDTWGGCAACVGVHTPGLAWAQGFVGAGIGVGAGVGHWPA